jgi:hypothetical protein
VACAAEQQSEVHTYTPFIMWASVRGGEAKRGTNSPLTFIVQATGASANGVTEQLTKLINGQAQDPGVSAVEVHIDDLEKRSMPELLSIVQSLILRTADLNERLRSLEEKESSELQSLKGQLKKHEEADERQFKKRKNRRGRDEALKAVLDDFRNRDGGSSSESEVMLSEE